MYGMNRRAINEQHWTQGWWWWWLFFFLKQLLSLTVSIGQSIQRHQLTLHPPSYVTSSAQPTLTQMKKSYSSSDSSSSSSSRSLYRQSIHHPEPRSNHHHHHQSTVAHTAHLTLLDFIDTTAANPIVHSYPTWHSRYGRSIHPSVAWISLLGSHLLLYRSIQSIPSTRSTCWCLWSLTSAVNSRPIHYSEASVQSIGLHSILYWHN